LRLPGYSGFQLVAQGGEGAVYRARQDGLGRDVAIKALQVVDPATQARFRRELEITVRLGRQHPHIVTVLDTGTLPDGRPCIVMEFYDLGSLHDRLRAHGPLPVAEVVAAGTAVSDALAFAHGQGFLHRDVKPQNVLVLPTSYVLADFGIARGADAGHSASLQMVSYRHAAPQMIAGETPAAADDLWSLGSTLFTLLTGHPPFAGENPDDDTVLSYLDRVRAADPRPVTRSDVPLALAEIITRCLSKRREDRFPDATALRDALASVGTDLRRWQPPVDPDATSIAPAAAQPAEDATSLPVDFGPSPTPAPTPAPAHEPPKPHPAPETRGTMTGRLADLTQRHSDPSPVDFGPGTAGPALPPTAPPPTWTPQPDLPSAATPASAVTPTSSRATPASSPVTPASPPPPPRLTQPEPPTAVTPARGTAALAHPTSSPQPEPPTAASPNNPADPASSPPPPQPEPPTAVAPANSTAGTALPPQPADQAPPKPPTSAPNNTADTAPPPHLTKPSQPERPTDDVPPSHTSSPTALPQPTRPSQQPERPATDAPANRTADSAPPRQPTRTTQAERPATTSSRSHTADPAVSRRLASPPRSEPPTPAAPAHNIAGTALPPQPADPTPPEPPSAAAPSNTAKPAPPTSPQPESPTAATSASTAIPPLTPPKQDHWQPPKQTPSQPHPRTPSTPFPARDTPTVPKLTPSTIDGFPAMPTAHEWEYDTAPRPRAEPQAKRWRGFAVAGIVAAVVGVGIGVLASRDVATTSPVRSTAPVTSTVSIPPGGDPAVAPVLTDVDDRGDEVELTWTDPTRGQAQFVLYDVTEAGDVPQPITGIAAGLTGFVVTGLDPGVPEYCFQLVAIGLIDPSTQRGASDRVCVSR
jgi:serine/threonine protein kinase